MALVVKDDAVFDYWHVGDGSSLFSFGGMIFFWGVIFLKLPSSLSFALPSVNFRTRPNPFLLTVSVILGIIFSSFSLFFYPIAKDFKTNRIDFQRLGNTPFLRKSCIYKILDIKLIW